MLRIDLYHILCLVLVLACKPKQGNVLLPSEISAEQAQSIPPGAQLFLTTPDDRSCHAPSLWPDALLDRMITNVDLPADEWTVQRTALKESLSSIPIPIALQILSHRGDLRVVSDLYAHCSFADYYLSPEATKGASFCIDHRESDFTVFLAGREDNQASIRAASSDAVFALVSAYTSIVMTNDPISDGYVQEASDLTLPIYDGMTRLVDILHHDYGVELPTGSERGLFTFMLFWQLCSEVTQTDLITFLPESESLVEEIVAASFEDDFGDSDVIAQIAREMEIETISAVDGLGLSGFFKAIASIPSSIRKKIKLPPRDSKRIKTKTFGGDVSDYNKNRERAATDIRSSGLDPEVEMAAIKRLEDVNTKSVKISRNWEAMSQYQANLDKIRNQPEFIALYEAQSISLSKNTYLQVPKIKLEQSGRNNGVQYGLKKQPFLANEINPTVQNITLTIPGTFEGQGTKVMGGWFDPRGDTAQSFARSMSLKNELNSEDFVASFRWRGENNLSSRNQDGSELGLALLNMADAAGVGTAIRGKAPLKINLAGHSHGGNLGYHGLTVIEELSTLQKRMVNKELSESLVLVELLSNRSLRNLTDNMSNDELINLLKQARKFTDSLENGSINVQILAMATPRRAEYLPPVWAKTMHIAVKGDGVAWLGKTDEGLDQIRRLKPGFSRNKDLAWKEFEKKVESNARGSFIRLNKNGYGASKAFWETHLHAPESMARHLERVAHDAIGNRVRNRGEGGLADVFALRSKERQFGDELITELKNRKSEDLEVILGIVLKNYITWQKREGIINNNDSNIVISSKLRQQMEEAGVGKEEVNQILNIAKGIAEKSE